MIYFSKHRSIVCLWDWRKLFYLRLATCSLNLLFVFSEIELPHLTSTLTPTSTNTYTSSATGSHSDSGSHYIFIISATPSQFSLNTFHLVCFYVTSFFMINFDLCSNILFFIRWQKLWHASNFVFCSKINWSWRYNMLGTIL